MNVINSYNKFGSVKLKYIKLTVKLTIFNNTNLLCFKILNKILKIFFFGNGKFHSSIKKYLMFFNK